MEVNKLRGILMANAKKAKACEPGLIELGTAGTKEEIARCFMEYIDFCLVNNYPDNTFLKLNFERELEAIGIYIDRQITLEKGKRMVFLGDCRSTVEMGEYSVCMIRAKHQSKISIKASGHTRIMVDALDDSVITVEATEKATVIVNLYARATSIGATKTIFKNRETYEL